MSLRDRLAAVLAPELLEALEDLVAEQVAAELANRPNPPTTPWLTLEKAGELLGCSRDAVRMRASRGRLETRRHGRRVYVSAASVAELGGSRHDATKRPGAAATARATATRRSSP